MLVGIGAGAILAGFALWPLLEGWRAVRWPHTTGTVLSVGQQKVDEGLREVLVRYSYTVGDETFEGTRIHPAYFASSFESAHEGLEVALLPGSRVRVYYRAGRPAKSVLSVGFISGPLAVAFGGLAFVPVGVGFLLDAIFSRAGALVGAAGFMTCWLLTVGFAIRGNWNFAGGITVEGCPPQPAGECDAPVTTHA
jgi:hypothetical protein